MRQRSMADITLSWPRLRWSALARRQAAPWARKMSATSSLSRGMTPAQAGCLTVILRCSSGLLTARRVVLATRAVARGGIEFAVARQDLDHPDVDLLLEQVGGEAMPERVQRDALVDAGRLPGAIKGATELARGERIDRVLTGKQPTLRP